MLTLPVRQKIYQSRAYPFQQKQEILLSGNQLKHTKGRKVADTTPITLKNLMAPGEIGKVIFHNFKHLSSIIMLYYPTFNID